MKKETAVACCCCCYYCCCCCCCFRPWPGPLLGAGCWVLGAGFCPVQDGGWRWTAGGPQASAFSLILLVDDQGPFPGLQTWWSRAAALGCG